VADRVTAGDGGRGALRELIDYILLKKGVYERAITAYVDSIS
jgi:3-deoxy-D-manno-octulosonate 8-phosphate phosphatase KdsC-like HAD superfamily phosphatase